MLTAALNSKRPKAFINYRRSDTQQAVIALRVALEARIGKNAVFVDVDDIAPGEQWPNRLKEELKEATVLLLVIGVDWLTAADEFGRRRIDKEEDAVRAEIKYALDHNLPIIPVLVSGQTTMPTKGGLPSELVGILDRESYCIRDESWQRDFDELARILVSKYRFDEIAPQPASPSAVSKPPADSTTPTSFRWKVLKWFVVTSMLAVALKVWWPSQPPDIKPPGSSGETDRERSPTEKTGSTSGPVGPSSIELRTVLATEESQGREINFVLELMNLSHTENVTIDDIAITLHTALALPLYVPPQYLDPSGSRFRWIDRIIVPEKTTLKPEKISSPFIPEGPMDLQVTKIRVGAVVNPDTPFTVECSMQNDIPDLSIDGKRIVAALLIVEVTVRTDSLTLLKYPRPLCFIARPEGVALTDVWKLGDIGFTATGVSKVLDKFDDVQVSQDVRKMMKDGIEIMAELEKKGKFRGATQIRQTWEFVIRRMR